MKSTVPAHIETIDALRAIAALSVCWYHATEFFAQFYASRPHPLAPGPDAVLSSLIGTGTHGFLGVQVFFVISGFVIPYALHRAQYRLPMMGRFLAKRLLRLDPPYLVAVVLAMAVSLFVHRGEIQRGAPLPFTWPQVLAHLGYLNAFIGLPWLISVFWTLAVEFQYYLTMALLYPVIARPGTIAALGIAAVSVACAWLCPSEAYLLHHLPLFAMGIAVFRHISLGAKTPETALLLGAATALGCPVLGWPRVAAGLLAALAILFVRYSNRILTFFGDISYSLYLIHAAILPLVITQTRNILGNSTAAWLSLLFVAMAVVIAAAWALYLLIEVPSKRLASRVSYSGRTLTTPAEGPYGGQDRATCIVASTRGVT